MAQVFGNIVNYVDFISPFNGRKPLVRGELNMYKFSRFITVIIKLERKKELHYTKSLLKIALALNECDVKDSWLSCP